VVVSQSLFASKDSYRIGEEKFSLSSYLQGREQGTESLRDNNDQRDRERNN
jgi:hypothetical protein